jgi:hypothetical protein
MSTPNSAGVVTDLSGNSPVQLPYIAASATALNQLAQSLNSYFVEDICGNKVNVGVTISAFLNNQSDQNSYTTMAKSISEWFDVSNNDHGPFSALGLNPAWNTNKGAQYGIRTQVILANGQTAYDSNSGTKNTFGNINKPTSTSAVVDTSGNVTIQWDGKWMINENQASRSYNMGAQLSNTGIFYQTAHSATVKKEQMYLVIRQGNSPASPLGNLVISMNTSPNDLTPVPTGEIAGDQ